MDIILHYHDGNIIAFKAGLETSLINEIKSQVTSVGNALGLCYKQELEVKTIL